MRQNIFGIFALTLFGISIISAADLPPLQYNDEGPYQYFTDNKVFLQYYKEGVLRKDENTSCNIMFVNLGGNSTICSLSKKFYKNSNAFNITLTGLTNGNLGLNPDTQFDGVVDLPKYIEITQNREKFTNAVFSNQNKDKFNLVLYNLTTCDGLKIQQNFKDELVTVANRLYYVNVVPDSINHAFDSKLFGPSYDYPFERIHWRINEGLEDLRKTCGIHMLYKGIHSSNTRHWQYYLSTESINTENCNVYQFFEVIKRNYIDYHFTEELLGKNYMGYVFKREGHPEVHMDGVIVNNNYLIEIYQNKCDNAQSEPKTSCTIRSQNALSFNEFTEKLIHDCLSKSIDENETITWKIESTSKAKGVLNRQTIEITKKDKGQLPKSKNNSDLIEYNTSTTANSTPIARFVITIKCGNGMFANEECQCQDCSTLKCGKGTFDNGQCQCQACASHCVKCNNPFTCIECEEDERVFKDDNSVCIIKKGFFDDPVDDEIGECKEECSECNHYDSCTVCKDPNAILSDGNCICPNSYMKADGLCADCEEGCGLCNKDGCLICLDDSTPSDKGCIKSEI